MNLVSKSKHINIPERENLDQGTVTDTDAFWLTGDFVVLKDMIRFSTEFEVMTC